MVAPRTLSQRPLLVRTIEVTTTLITKAEVKKIGEWATNAYDLSGYIDGFRITKGKALFTANFPV